MQLVIEESVMNPGKFDLKFAVGKREFSTNLARLPKRAEQFRIDCEKKIKGAIKFKD